MNQNADSDKSISKHERGFLSGFLQFKYVLKKHRDIINVNGENTR